MNWKKWLKYIGISFVAIVLITALVVPLVLQKSLTQMWGINTKVVNTSQFKPAIGPVAIKNVNILETNSESFISGQMVLIKEGKIKTIDSTLDIPNNVTTIDGAGKYLIPGLIDSHVHSLTSPNDLLLYIANGITGIREMIGVEDRLGLKREIKNGRIGPQVWISSPPLGTAHDLGTWFVSWSRGGENVSDAVAAEKMIKDFHEKGYDGVKIYSHLNNESYLAATKKANELGLPIVGHIPWSIDLADVWENGQSEIAHIEEVMNIIRRAYGRIETGESNKFLTHVLEESEGIADNLLKHDISVTSTLWLVESFVKQKFELDKVLKEVELSYANAGVVEGIRFGDSGFGWLPGTNLNRLGDGLTEEEKVEQKEFWETYAKACQLLIKAFAKKGVKLLAGTDANAPVVIPGFSLHAELERLQKAGMTNAQVLHAATVSPADFMNIKAGKIEEGYDAHLVLLDKNPLENIRHTKTINMVFSNGKMYDRTLLDQMLAAVKAANDESRTIDISEFENEVSELVRR